MSDFLTGSSLVQQIMGMREEQTLKYENACRLKNLTIMIEKGWKKEISVTLATSTAFACKKWIH